MNIVVLLAGINVELCVIYIETAQFFKEYLNDGNPKYKLAMTYDRIVDEINALKQENPYLKYTESEAEINAIYRDLTEILKKENAIFFHALLLQFNAAGVLFAAPSGVGKSTHGNIWLEVFNEKVKIINGDKPILRITRNGVYGYGSPWKGKEKIGCNTYIPVKAICHIVRGQDNYIYQIKNNLDCFEWFCNQAMLKNRNLHLLYLLKWFKAASVYINFYELRCNMEREAAIIACQEILGYKSYRDDYTAGT